MKIDRRNNPKKKKVLISAAVIVLALLLALAIYLYAFKGSIFGWSPIAKPATSTINYDKPTDDQKKAGASTKENTVSNSGDASKPNNTSSDQPPTPTPQPSGKSKVDVTITSSNQNGSLLQVRAIISNVTNTGTCTLTLSKSGRTTITKTAAIQPLPSSSTCKGFDIATSELTPGTWQLALHFENSTLVGDASKSVAIQ